jgi:hypothetical protein
MRVLVNGREVYAERGAKRRDEVSPLLGTIRLIVLRLDLIEYIKELCCDSFLYTKYYNSFKKDSVSNGSTKSGVDKFQITSN